MLEKYWQNCSAMDLGSVNSLLLNLKLHDIFRLLDFLFKTSFKEHTTRTQFFVSKKIITQKL